MHCQPEPSAESPLDKLVMAAPLQAVMRHVQASYWLFNKLFENRSVFAFVFIFVKRFFEGYVY